MKKLLIFAAVGEGVTGLALLIVPSLVGQLLLGEELTGIAIPIARVAGIALTALAIACWPGPPLLGMLIYSTLVTLYLAYVGSAVRSRRHAALPLRRATMISPAEYQMALVTIIADAVTADLRPGSSSK
jgi:hypothetical protein